MRRGVTSSALAALLLAGVLPAPASAQDEPEDDPRHNTTQPKEAEQPVPVLTPAVPPPAEAAAAPKPKFGDLTTSGYLRGSFGASNHKGRMTCFKLRDIPGGMFAKYRLGNECEVWGEFHLTTVVYAGDDGTVASLHFMPTVYIPTTYIGYSPNGAVSAPDQFLTSTGAVLYFPNLYADIKGISWLGGGTAWAGTRYYKRESVYINDFFYWNPSGVGAGVEDIHFGPDIRFSYGAFAVDGEPVSSDATSPSLPQQVDFGVRNDFQLRGLRPWESGEIQIGVQAIMNLSNNPASAGGWGVTLQYVQKALGGDNKLVFQYGRGGGTGFGTLSRFYYPDFSVRHELSEARWRVVDVFTFQPIEWLGGQIAGIFQHDDLGTVGSQTNWYSAGGRLGIGFARHAKLLGETGYDRVTKTNGADAQYMLKATGAIAITADRGFLARPELRLFYTWAVWNDAARIAGVDSGRLYTDVYTNVLSGSIFGVQAETWW